MNEKDETQMTPEELEAATRPETDEQSVPEQGLDVQPDEGLHIERIQADDLSEDELRAQMLDEDQPVEETVDVPVVAGPGDSTKRTIQGNTDPRDFDIFDEGGNFVEKRDR